MNSMVRLLLAAATVQAPAPTQVSPGAAATAHYNARETFGRLVLPEVVNRYRSSSGAPGPDYWQNRADYQIDARLDPASKVLSGSEIITYTNNSPDRLTSLWLQLDQNSYRPDARAAVNSNPRRQGQFTSGFSLQEVAVERDGAAAVVTPVISDTRMRVPLANPLQPGAKVRLHIRYHYTVPGVFGGHTAWLDTSNGLIFDVAQWFPRMCVYDDVRGWDTLPYIHQEFYLEYGDFDYAVTAPADMVVVGSGELTNPDEVLTPTERARLAEAHASDSTVTVRTAADVAAAVARPASGSKTWRYHMAETRDVVFSASRAFIWDAARIRLPGAKTALAESLYPVESQGQGAWGRSTEYLKDAVERFSQRWYSYPYPTAVNVAGGAEGIENPGFAFDGIEDKGKDLFWITAHEIGHTWFPMTVGSDERRDAWMDEGFNTFIDTFESDEFESGVYGPKRDSEYAPGGGNPADEILPVLADPNAPPILTRADIITERYRHPVTYFKAALGLKLLREQILGPERFDPAFRKYISDWAFKHPKPSDFFRSMESEGGEDLSWFWRGWFVNNWGLDLALKDFAYVDGDPAKGARVTVESQDRLVMPAVLEARYADGSTERVHLPVESWIQGPDATLTLPKAGRITRLVLDPDHLLPDHDRSNNILSP